MPTYDKETAETMLKVLSDRRDKKRIQSAERIRKILRGGTPELMKRALKTRRKK